MDQQSGRGGMPTAEAQALLGAVRDYAIFFLAPDGTILTWNEGARAIKGYEANEIIGRSFERFFTADDLRSGRPQRLLETATREGRVEDEAWRVRKDGTRFWADVVITPIRDPGGRLRGYVKVTRDMTERRRHEEALRQGEQRLRLMIDSVHDYAIFLLDATGHVTSWHLGAERLKGYTPPEIIGRHFSCFYPAADVEAGKPAHELGVAAANGRYEDEGWRVRKDGSRFWANVVISAVRDAAGQVVGFTKVTRDLTERVQRERQQVVIAELGGQALRTRDLVAVMRSGVDEIGKTLDVELVQLMEATAEGTAVVVRAVTDGAGVRDVVTIPAPPGSLLAAAMGADGPLIIDDLATADAFGDREPFQGAGAVSGVLVPIHASRHGTRAWGVLAVWSRRPRGFSPDQTRFLQAVVSLLATAIDRRAAEDDLVVAELDAKEERHRAALARAALRERDDFISVAAHELRTPLTVLTLKLQGMEQAYAVGNGSAARTSHRLAGALRQTERLTELVERLLDVSRIMGGRLTLNRKPLDLSEVVRHVADDVAEAAASAQCLLRVTAPPGLTGHWDRARLEQAVLNLVGNALKYGAGQPVEISAEIEADVVRLRVVDHGIGVSEGDARRIFDRFERAAPVENYAGLGLGLYITRAIVEAHGGTVSVASRTGEGSTFTIELPREAGTQA